MFRKLNTFLLGSVASFLALVAVLGIGTACIGSYYEPPIPEELKK
ncbi:MAG: cyclic lactone autoinducer peptide [Bacillota bacterium]